MSRLQLFKLQSRYTLPVAERGGYRTIATTVFCMPTDGAALLNIIIKNFFKRMLIIKGECTADFIVSAEGVF